MSMIRRAYAWLQHHPFTAAIIVMTLIVAPGYGLLVLQNSDLAKTDERLERNDARLESLIAQRELDLQQARYSSCVNANVDAKKARDSVERQARELIGAARRDAETDPESKAYIDRQVKGAEATYPYRDCSPRGIAEWIKTPPADPAVPTPTSSLS